MKRICIAGCLLSLVWAAPARAEIRLPKVIGDHMVIQQSQPATIWGWADAGEKVVVEMGQSRGETTADAAGKWSLKSNSLVHLAVVRLRVDWREMGRTVG